MKKNRTAKAKAKSLPKAADADLFVHPGASTLTGKIDKGVNAKIAALPFVRSRKRGEKKGGTCWWSVKASGDYQADYEQGQMWACLVVPLLKYNVGAPLLSWIVVDMIKAGERNGLVLGFVREIGDQLKTARINLLFAVAATERKKLPARYRVGAAAIRKAWRDGRPDMLAGLADAI